MFFVCSDDKFQLLLRFVTNDIYRIIIPLNIISCIVLSLSTIHDSFRDNHSANCSTAFSSPFARYQARLFCVYRLPILPLNCILVGASIVVVVVVVAIVEIVCRTGCHIETGFRNDVII